MDAYRVIAGWGKFFAVDDFRALDTRLLQQRRSEDVQRRVYQAQCTVTRDVPGATELKLQCTSDAIDARGVNLAGRFDHIGSGRIDWLNLGPAGQVRDILIEGEGAKRVGSEYVWRGVLKKAALAARLPDGRALESVEIRWPAQGQEDKGSKSTQARFEVTVIDDFASVRQAVRQLLAKQPALFDNLPLARATLMRALFSELGMPERSWCCFDEAGMPPAMLDPPAVSASAVAKREWQPFFHYCAMCHLTNEQFPPNFLSGDAARVAESLRQCAPRMLVRLSAWGTPVDQRIKSPMPPATALQTLGTTTQRWAASEELERLRAYLEGLSRRDGQPTDVGELLKAGYEALPGCLPAAHTR
jgi:hypothetical protein